MADGRLQKNLGSSIGWPISVEATTLSPWRIKLPLAWSGKTAWARPGHYQRIDHAGQYGHDEHDQHGRANDLSKHECFLYIKS